MNQENTRQNDGAKQAVRVVRHRFAEHQTITMTVGAVIEHTGLGRTAIYELLKSGRLKAVKAGRSTLILADSLRDYIASLPPAKFSGSQEQA